jgi:hypothetical protein
MDRRGQGLTDKLYWREIDGRHHCFKRHREGGYVSLCGNRAIPRSGGQAIARPKAVLRCAACDVREMARRGSDESMPATTDTRRGA